MHFHGHTMRANNRTWPLPKCMLREQIKMTTMSAESNKKIIQVTGNTRIEEPSDQLRSALEPGNSTSYLPSNAAK